MENLSEAARAVITSLQALPEAPELQRANIVIIGGLALQHHAPGFRPTHVSWYSWLYSPTLFTSSSFRMLIS
jgi:hypothetical protein